MFTQRIFKPSQVIDLQNLPTGANQMIARKRAGNKFGFEAARPTRERRRAMFPEQHPESTRVQHDAVSMMFEARDLAENVGFVKGHLRKIQLYGAGTLIYEPTTGDEGMNSEIREFMQHFNATAHINGEHTMTRLIQLALIGMVRDRDSLLVWVRDEDENLKLQIVEADQIGELFIYSHQPDYVQGVYLSNGMRTGYRVYDRMGDMMYGNPQDIPASDAMFFFDPMRARIRGITAYETCITNIRDKFEILGFEKVVVKDISTTGIITYTQRGQADAFDYDDTHTSRDGDISFIKHKESGTREFMGIGENFQVVPNSRPSSTFQGFLQTLDEENCLGLNLPYGFMCDLSQAGGASARLIAHVANREFERIQRDVLSPQLDKIRSCVLADAAGRGEISWHPNLLKGHWMFPPPPTADIQRESDIAIREVRAGISTTTEQFAQYGQSRKEQWQIKKEEAIDRHLLAFEATAALKKLGINATVSPDEISSLTDNPAQLNNQQDVAPKTPTAATPPPTSAAANAPATLSGDAQKKTTNEFSAADDESRDEDGRWTDGGGGGGGKKDSTKKPKSGKIESDGIPKKPTKDSKPNDDAGTASPKSIESAAHDAAGSFGTIPGHDASLTERRERIAKTQENLKNWAEKNGLLKTASAIPKKNTSGAEHNVFIDEKKGIVTKVTRPESFNGYGIAYGSNDQGASPDEYLDRMAQQNRLFDDHIKIKAVVPNGNGKMQIVTTQPLIRGRDATPIEIDDLMQSRGFNKINEGAYYSPKEGLMVYDMFPKNVKVSESDGAIHPVDPVIQRVTPDFAEFFKNY